MNKDSVYAIVDLETTGTNVQKGDRIIQFGCVLVQHGQIIDQLAFDVNPERSVPSTILQLTHLTTQQLTVAPYFEDVAATIRQLLEQTVFVAHNVNFDYPFLNAELQRVGQPALNLAAIDTVELAQVLLPTAISYRLRDLTKLLAIEHTNPHQADSDALVTAKLFIALTQRLAQLPLVTRQALAECAVYAVRQTGDYFAYYAQQPAGKLPDYLYISHGLALRKKQLAATRLTGTTKTYPHTDAEKKHYLRPLLKWRKTQGKMMDAIYLNFTSEQPQPLILEAATGLGKSLGYLLPFSFLLQGKQQLVVSTATAVLQAQFVQQTVPLLNQLLGLNLTAAIVKSPQHYIDLAKFKQALQTTDKLKPVQLLKMQLLVWLTMTTTGDFTELHLANYHTPLFAQICHYNQDVVSEKAPFAADDFWRAARQKQQQADVLVTNHAFLSQHAVDTDFFPAKSYLVVDEAQQFPTAATKASGHQLMGNAITLLLRRFHHLLAGNHAQDSLAELVAATPLVHYTVTSLDYGLSEFEQLLGQLQEQLNESFMQPVTNLERAGGYFERTLDNEAFARWLQENRGSCRKLYQLLNNCLLLSSKLSSQLLTQQVQWLKSEQKNWLTFNQYVQELVALRQQLQAIFKLLTQPDQGQLIWLTLKDNGDVASLALHLSRLDIAPLSQQLLTHFAPPVFTGATLSVDRQFTYFKQLMGVTKTQFTEKRFASPFRYKRQAALFAVTDGPGVREVPTDAYAMYVAQALVQLLQHNQRQTLVLFNSLQMIEAVYRALFQTTLPRHHEIFAQGVTGSKERIIKRFGISERGILLGTGSFWAGIDLPKKALEQVVIARLPFAAPSDALTKARYQKINQAQQNPFFKAALPQATLKLRQGFGRLIRTSSDYGVLVILDNRIMATNYGKRMLKALPPSLPKNAVALNDLGEQVSQFFAEKV